MLNRLYALSVLALFLTGCGSGGSSSPSVYAGSWDGIYQAGSETGAIAVVVNSKGRFTGTYTDSVGGGSVSGTISNGGTVDLGMRESATGIEARGRGSGAIGQDGHLTATLQAYAPEGATGALYVDLQRR